MAKVIWTFQAMEDLADINHYLSQNSEKYADFIVTSILAVTEQLEQFPNSGRIVPEMRINSIRELIVSKYRIIYQIVALDSVSVLTIRHSSKPLSEF
jgi:addiction module RelE/StbE family toxin